MKFLVVSGTQCTCTDITDREGQVQHTSEMLVVSSSSDALLQMSPITRNNRALLYRRKERRDEWMKNGKNTNTCETNFKLYPQNRLLWELNKRF